MTAECIHFISIILLSFLFFSHGRDYDEALKHKYGKLVHVSIIFRHGDRAPVSTYPNDPHKSYLWPDGLGQLLKTGKLRMYNLGKWFRKQYKDLLNSIHSHTRMIVDSSDVDRTIMSAQYFLASFYKPNKTECIFKSIRWQPVPIHTSSIKDENYIWMYTPCPREEYYTKKFFKLSKMKKRYDKHEKTFKYLHKHSGITFSRNKLQLACWSIYKLFDTLNIQKSTNLTLPSWTKKVYPGTLNKLLKLFLFQELNDPKVLRLKAGPIIKSIITDFVSAKNLTNNSRKIFHFYSGHETTIAVIMHVLGNYDGVNPPYGSALMLELRNKGTDNFIVVRYKNSSNSSPKLLDIPKCGEPCTLEKFINMTRPLMVQNWKLECQLKNRKNETSYENIANFM